MRLTFSEIKSIIEVFYKTFKEGKIYLFGSRLNEKIKGGDIDLYLELNNHENLPEKKIMFLSQLKEKIGEQKVDIVFNIDENRIIENEIKENMKELNLNILKLNKYFSQCDKHVQRIEEAYEDLKDCIPLTVESYEKLNKSYVQAIDQYLFRFSKLHDTIGSKIFILLLSFYEENNSIPFLDLLNKLEKLGFLTSSKEWNTLREIRNEISHQYEDEPENMSKSINLMVTYKDVLIGIYKKIKKKYTEDILKITK